MGEIAEMMLDGTMCAGCGEWMGDEGDGFPRYCAACRPPRHHQKRQAVAKPIAPASLSPKLIKRLEWIRDRTDSYAGMYPGDYLDAATKQHSQLIRHGLIEIFEPHNPAHKERVVVTGAGRSMLASLKKDPA